MPSRGCCYSVPLLCDSVAQTDMETYSLHKMRQISNKGKHMSLGDQSAEFPRGHVQPQSHSFNGQARMQLTGMARKGLLRILGSGM